MNDDEFCTRKEDHIKIYNTSKYTKQILKLSDTEWKRSKDSWYAHQIFATPLSKSVDLPKKSVGFAWFHPLSDRKI